MDQENASTSKLNTQKHENNFTRKLVCINYPGIVENTTYMLETLGGISELESVVTQRNGYLELRLRPEDRFCKPAMSDVDKKSGVLVKIAKKEAANGKEEYKYEVLGLNALSYSFNKFCDFQYLPLVTNEKETKETPLECIYRELHPDGIPTEDWLKTDKAKSMPPFLPSGTFSRFDYPTGGMFNKTSQPLNPSKVKTVTNSVLVRFEDEEMPMEPPESVIQLIEIKPSFKSHYNQLKAMFEERPIWTRNALMYKCQMTMTNVKFVFPAVAYFNKNGPWRTMWTRYGYDPRKDPNSRMYQTFDFRVRSTFGLKEIVKIKTPSKGGNSDKKSLDEVFKHKDDSETMSENIYLLKPGLLPPGRQVFYQYCDVKLPEIQTMLNRLPPVQPSTKCTFKNGWLPDKFNDQCREIVNRYIEEIVQKRMEEYRRQDPVEVGCKNDTENVVDMLEISDTDSELSDDDIINNEFSSGDEEIKKRNEDSDDGFIDKDAADEVANFLGKISKKEVE